MKHLSLAFALAMTGIAASAQNTTTTNNQNDSVAYDKQLDNLEVVAQKPVVKMTTDKMSYDVQQDADSKSMTVLDMLRKVPMVTVDGQDNITVNGSSSFKVLVDGKPNIQIQSNAKMIFKAMPASMVDKIEVLTNPGAKYDAEGVGGVLNIIMHREGGKHANLNGYNGEVSMRVGNKGGMASANIAGQNKKLSYNFNLYGGYNSLGNIDYADERIQQDATINSSSDAKQSSPFTGATLGLGYEIDSINVVNASVGFNYFNQKQTGNCATAMSGSAYGNGFGYNFDNSNKSFSYGINASADWQHFFNTEHTHSFTLSYQFSNSPSRNKSYRYYQDITGTAAFDLNDSYSDNQTRAAEHTIQADYTVPMSETQTLNAGAKYILRNNKVDADYYLLDDAGNYADPSTTTDYDNRQQILAGYVEHKGTYGKWGTVEGLRYEHTWESIDYPEMSQQNFKKNYGNLVPSATLSYNFEPRTNLGLSYTMRILRPGISYMNPYRDPSDATSVQYGNSDLKVEYSHNINLVFNHFGQRFMMNAKLGQTICNNQIAQYSFTEQGKLNTTYGNNVKNRWTNFNTWMRFIPSQKTSIMFNGYLGYGDIRSEQLDARNHGWQASAMIMLEQQLPWKIKWNLGVQASTRTYNIQGYQGGMTMAYTVLTRSFCKDRLNLSLFAMSPLTGKLKITTYKHSSQFENTTKISLPLQVVQFSIGWKFGNTDKQFSNHKSKIDSNFGESQSQGEKLNSMSSGM